MRRLRPILCLLGLALLVPALSYAHRTLPVDTAPLVAEKYAGWSGVLRLWVFEGWPCGGGSLSPWLNDCVARFERRHAGVYVQPTFVDAGAIASMSDSGIPGPDMILFPPGLLDAPTGLTALTPPDGVRAGLAASGARGGPVYAVPVAMGGYLWAINTALLPALPATWRGAEASPAVPEPEPWRHWGAALLALCAGQRAEASDGAAEIGGAGLDFGLMPSDTPAPTSPPVDAPACRLPEGFACDADAWQRFINGEAAAMPVSQREVRRLEALSARGRGPDWQLAGSCAFTDQLLSLAIPEKPADDPHLPLCVAFLDWLLSDECQGALCLASAFSVTDAASGYGPGDPLERMDAALRAGAPVVPNAFDTAWPDAASEIVRKFMREDGEAPALWASLADRLSENTNIP